MSRPRITLVAASCDTLGGQAVQAATLARGLERDGYEVTLLPVNPRFPSALRSVRGVPLARTVLNEALYLPTLSRLRQSDVVHVFSAAYWSFLLAPAPAILAARALRKRIVLNYHSGEADDHLRRWERIVRPWIRGVDAIVVPSEYLRSVFERHGYRVQVIRNVVDTDAFRYRVRSPLRPRLISTRNLEPHYRVDNTIRAFAILRSRHPQATLAVAGTGGEEPRLRRLAASLGVGDIAFAGRVEPADMPARFDEADIFVNSSEIDNQPISILEAFAAGTPVVSTAPGGIAGLVRHRDTGLEVPPRDPAAMAAAIARLVESPGQAAEIARRARRLAEEFTWSRVREQWKAVYSGIDA